MKQTKAMTLAEMMVTLAIVTILAVSSLSVASRLMRAQQTDISDTDTAVLAGAVKNLLNADMMHASQANPTVKCFALVTLAEMDPKTMQVRHLPVQVEYAIEEIGKQKWLIRTQGTGKKAIRQLVCNDVEEISLSSPKKNEESTGDSKSKSVASSFTIAIDWKGGRKDSLHFRLK